MSDDLRAARRFATEATEVPGAPWMDDVFPGYDGGYIASLVRDCGDTDTVGSFSLSVQGGTVTGWRLGSRSGASVVSLKAALIDRFGLGNPAGY